MICGFSKEQTFSPDVVANTQLFALQPDEKTALLSVIGRILVLHFGMRLHAKKQNRKMQTRYISVEQTCLRLSGKHARVIISFETITNYAWFMMFSLCLLI